jgi:RHS repeat-associated protein
MPGRSYDASAPPDQSGFTGYQFEEEGGLDLYHAEARSYDQVIGRFTSRDPLYDEYPSWSPYTYTLNNPLIYTDPTGEFVFTAIGAVVGGVMAAIKGEDWKGIGIGALSGAAAGAVVDIGIASGGTSLVAGAIVGATSSATGSFVHQGLTNGTVDLASLAIDASIGAVFGGLSGWAASGVAGHAYSRAITRRGVVDSGGEAPLMEVVGKNLSKVTKSKTTESLGDRFTKITEVRPGKGPGQSRAEYVRYKNSDGKTIRSYKDSYDRANKWWGRKPTRGDPEGKRGLN